MEKEREGKIKGKKSSLGDKDPAATYNGKVSSLGSPSLESQVSSSLSSMRSDPAACYRNKY